MLTRLVSAVRRWRSNRAARRAAARCAAVHRTMHLALARTLRDQCRLALDLEEAQAAGDAEVQRICREARDCIDRACEAYIRRKDNSPKPPPISREAYDTFFSAEQDGPGAESCWKPPDETRP